MSRLGAALIALSTVVLLATGCSHGSTQSSACDQLKGNKLANSVSQPLQKAMVDQADASDYLRLDDAVIKLKSLASQKGVDSKLSADLKDAASAIQGVIDRKVTDADIKHVQTAFDNLGKEVKSSCGT